MENYAATFIKKHQEKWKDDPSIMLEKYKYQKCLTSELDEFNAKGFDRERLYEIVLWKLNRFPCVDDELIDGLTKGIPPIPEKEHRKSEAVLGQLLRCKGIALPMASTILRFLNPKTFQIIDERAYRSLFPDQNYPKNDIASGNVQKSICIYFNYLDTLHKISSKKLPFDKSDRILYQLDKEYGNKL